MRKSPARLGFAIGVGVSCLLAGLVQSRAADIVPIVDPSCPKKGTTYNYQFPCGPVLDKVTDGPLRDSWCESDRGRFEARRDFLVSANGSSYDYTRESDLWDCDDAGDRRCIPLNTRQKVC